MDDAAVLLAEADALLCDAQHWTKGRSRSQIPGRFPIFTTYAAANQRGDYAYCLSGAVQGAAERKITEWGPVRLGRAMTKAMTRLGSALPEPIGGIVNFNDRNTTKFDDVKAVLARAKEGT